MYARGALPYARKSADVSVGSNVYFCMWFKISGPVCVHMFIFLREIYNVGLCHSFELICSDNFDNMASLELFTWTKSLDTQTTDTFTSSSTAMADTQCLVSSCVS